MSCTIKGTGYGTSLAATGQKNSSGERIYEGELWDSSMVHRFGQKGPEEVVFLFKAEYEDGTAKEDAVTVIVDDSDWYWQLHRQY